MLILMCIVIGIFTTLGIVFTILMLWPNKRSLTFNKFQTLEFEIETEQGIHRGKLRYRTLK